MRKERVNINLNNNNKKIGLVKEENVPNALVSLEINGHELQFAISRDIVERHFPPAPPNNCNGVTNAASYAALVKSDSKCESSGSSNSYSSAKMNELDDLMGIKVQGAPKSELKIERKNIEHSNIDVLKLLIGEHEFNLLNETSKTFEISDTGLDLLIIEAKQHGFILGDLNKSNTCDINDVIILLNIALGNYVIDDVNQKITDLAGNFIVEQQRDKNGNLVDVTLDDLYIRTTVTVKKLSEISSSDEKEINVNTVIALLDVVLGNIEFQ